MELNRSVIKGKRSRVKVTKWSQVVRGQPVKVVLADNDEEGGIEIGFEEISFNSQAIKSGVCR